MTFLKSCYGWSHILLLTSYIYGNQIYIFDYIYGIYDIYGVYMVYIYIWLYVYDNQNWTILQQFWNMFRHFEFVLLTYEDIYNVTYNRYIYIYTYTYIYTVIKTGQFCISFENCSVILKRYMQLTIGSTIRVQIVRDI